MLPIFGLLSCLQSRQLTNECSPAANPLPVQTVGTFTGPRQTQPRRKQEEEELQQWKKGKKNPAATASVRVIPVIPVLLWQQARALVKKIENKEKEKEKDMYFI